MHQGHQLASRQVRDWRFDTSLPGAPRPNLSAMAGTGRPAPETPAPGTPGAGTPATGAPAEGQDRITLAPVPESAKAAREFTTATLRRWHLDSLVSDAVLIASELVTNAISHGDQTGAPLHLAWACQAGRLICVVTDRAAGPPVMADADADAESGHGLQIVAALAASWGWTMLGSGRKAVWAALPLSAPAVADRGPLPGAAIPAAGPGRLAAVRAADRGRPDPFPAAR
jgi:anti-sigma regulatory factor (Ser/Thr protein kinase)